MKISVCLITYNGSSYIKEQIDSILAQTIPVNEIIVSNDASTDNTLSILQTYSLRFPELFKILNNTSNIGAVQNIEHCIKAASGDILFLADQDDIWMPNKVATSLNYFKQNPSIKGLFTNGFVINAKGETISSPMEEIGSDINLWDSMSFPIKEIGNDINLLKYITEVENFATGATMAFYKQLPFLEKPFPIINGLFHDRWIALNLCLNNEMGLINEPLIKYRQHEHQVVGGKNENQAYYLDLNARLYKNDFNGISFKQYKDLSNKCDYNLTLHKKLVSSGLLVENDDEVLNTSNQIMISIENNIMKKIYELDAIGKASFPILFLLRKFKKFLVSLF